MYARKFETNYKKHNKEHTQSQGKRSRCAKWWDKTLILEVEGKNILQKIQKNTPHTRKTHLNSRGCQTHSSLSYILLQTPYSYGLVNENRRPFQTICRKSPTFSYVSVLHTIKRNYGEFSSSACLFARQSFFINRLPVQIIQVSN